MKKPRTTMFDELYVLEGEADMLLPDHVSGIRLHRPSTAPSARYECLRCAKVQSGAHMTAVRLDTVLGICQDCASPEEVTHARRLRSASSVRRGMVHQTTRQAQAAQVAESMARRRIETTQEPWIQPPCDRCHAQAEGGRMPSVVEPAAMICATCKEAELGQLRETFRKSTTEEDGEA